MACQSGAMAMQLSLLLRENEASGSSCMVLAPPVVSNSIMESCINSRVFFRLKSSSFYWNGYFQTIFRVSYFISLKIVIHRVWFGLGWDGMGREAMAVVTVGGNQL